MDYVYQIYGKYSKRQVPSELLGYSRLELGIHDHDDLASSPFGEELIISEQHVRDVVHRIDYRLDNTYEWSAVQTQRARNRGHTICHKLMQSFKSLGITLAHHQSLWVLFRCVPFEETGYAHINLAFTPPSHEGHMKATAAYLAALLISQAVIS